MAKIIRCDFRRTERRNKLDRVLEDIYYLCEIYKAKDIGINEENMFDKVPSARRLQRIYADLAVEEQEWGQCEYFK